ncbi:MAG TPA: Crp/Fnr family transcriptional regulator [Chitinivibrionales bacterium]|nr:Crp/Fnr family transcriptional regulator [Chitinivibrionales bacterium]
MDISLLLDYSDFFKGISKKSKETLAAVCIPKTLQKNETLFSEGDTGHNMYLLSTGNIRVFKSGPGGRESVIKIIRPGEIFAEVILFEEDEYPASAAAVKKSLVYLIPKRQFSILLSDQSFRNDFIAILMKKQRYLAGRIHYLTSCDVEERFVRFLEEQYGRKQEYRILIPKKDIAQAIGTTSETFSRLMKRMQKDRILTLKKDRIVMREKFWADKQPSI